MKNEKNCQKKENEKFAKKREMSGHAENSLGKKQVINGDKVDIVSIFT